MFGVSLILSVCVFGIDYVWIVLMYACSRTAHQLSFYLSLTVEAKGD